jgi:ribonuclease HI
VSAAKTPRPPRLILYTDGAARGNPGPAGAGAHLEDETGKTIASVARYIGEATNNVAEYTALLLGLERARELGVRHVEVRADSELMVKQMRGEYRVRNAGLKPLHERARALASSFDGVTYVHVRRELNQAADRLANHAIDRRHDPAPGAPPEASGS